MNCYVWSKAVHGVETWTLRKLDKKTLKVLKCNEGKDGENHLDRPCKEWSIITESKERQEHPTSSRREKG
jgi:hypothetical protein